jgi:anti-sigma factor RsiW
MEPEEAKHPDIEELALLVGGELSYVRRWQVQNHVNQCASCDEAIERFQAAREELKRLSNAEMLTAFEAVGDWQRLEREMTGNISVGVAAARAIGDGSWRRTRRLRLALAGAGLVLIFIAGWILNVPADDNSRIVGALRTAWAGPQVAAGIILKATPYGVSVRSQGAILTVLQPASSNVSTSFKGSSSVEAQYVDDTGQVTITNVYGE